MKAESWDEERDLRRYWWVLPPLTFAVLTFAITVVLSRGNGSGQSSLSDELVQTYEAGERPSLAIDTVAGDVTVSTGEGTTVQVYVRRKATGATGDEAFDNLARLRLAISGSESLISIVASEEPAAVPSGRVRADIRVVVPKDTEVDIATGGGTITLRGIRGHIGAFTASGDMAVSVGADALFRLYVSGRRFRSEIPVTADTAPTRSSFHGHTGNDPGRVIKLSAPNGVVELLAE